MSSFENTALLIIGHGSTVNPDSATPTHQHADEIRRRGLFSEVKSTFWKEEPWLCEAFYTLESKEVYVVPNFISEGYFCQQVIPRELQLNGPITERDGKTFFYCDPVGIHPSMTRLLLKRADEVAPGVPRNQTCLIIVGHGTSLNENSRKAIEDQVALIRKEHDFAEVLDAYMEEEPLVNKWYEMASSPNVVVVPFFIADGLHSYQDIPVLLGFESEPTAALSQMDVFRHNPHLLHDKNLYYSSAIGTEELMADVILDQVHDFDAKYRSEKTLAPAPDLKWNPPAETFTLGQIRISKVAEFWILTHAEDSADDALSLYTKPEDARELSTYDDAGTFRGLKTAPNLKRGWKLQLDNDAQLQLALDFFYPGTLGFDQHEQNGTLKPVHLRETLGRQTGMYRFSNTISDDQAQEMVARMCDPQTNCLRRITWQLSADQPLTKIPPEKRPATHSCENTPLLCVEACTYLVSEAREIARSNKAKA